MITNEKQYRITKAALTKFEKSLEGLLNEQKQPHKRPKMLQAHIDAARSEIEILRDALQDYDDLRQGRVAAPELTIIEELPRALIRGRIASGMTQAQLAQAAHLSTQQIQKYEATSYAGASLSRVREIAQILIGAKPMKSV